MDPPADYNQFGQSWVPSPVGRVSRHPSNRVPGGNAVCTQTDRGHPYHPRQTASPSWDHGPTPRAQSPDHFRGQGFHQGNIGRTRNPPGSPLGHQDRGIPSAGIQQSIRPSPQRNDDLLPPTPDRNRPYQESFRGRYLGKSRQASLSSRGSIQESAFTYNNPGFQSMHQELDRKSQASSRSAQVGYRFEYNRETTRPEGRVKNGYDESNYIYRDREHINGGPAWAKRLNGGIYAKDDHNEDYRITKTKSGVGGAILLRVLTCLLLFWDLLNDWMIGAAGSSPFVQHDSLDNGGKCTMNKAIFVHLNISLDNVGTTICSDTVDMWNSLTVFMLLASVITILQCINILMEIISIVRRKIFFRILSGQSELFLMIFVEEIPQAIIMVVLLFHCECPPIKVDINLFALLASISACASAIFRLGTSYDHLTGNNGCCNQWWRCCCCRNNEYCCEIKPRDLFCTCEIPFPMCCCTLTCRDCKCSPVTWCNFILKAFGCFCDCCQDKDVTYGIRLVNLFGISLLLLSVGLQIFIFVV